MSRPIVPSSDDMALKMVLHALDSGPKTIAELTQLTTLNRVTVVNKLRKARNMYSPDKRNALIVPIEIGPQYTLYVRNPIFTDKPDLSIPYDQVERYALAIVVACKNNIELMIAKLEELSEKQAYKESTQEKGGTAP